ncbi:phosphotransferase family protein [Bacillus sp. FJAT-49705]|uniref:Phosphotransferase family protein n=1 Tax=Cytobacillus citreus TaxID=2833586 RepID=A0ABS5NX09_9BACI|nr:phosphotransferase family protein [Cytobacillus citreus]MBS4192371.1 phosphotransferase family protein [Cytobacillus citreus]
MSKDQATWNPADGDTIVVRQGDELYLEGLDAYLRGSFEHLDDSPLVVRQFGQGASNLTYLLRKGNWEAVLRRPPHGPVAPKAHDMAREYKLLKKIHAVFPLAPEPYLFCDDKEIIGSAFLLMERRKGLVLDTEFPASHIPSQENCRKISESMVGRLVELHQIDYEAAGLQELGYPTGFMDRQVHGWIGRYERAKTAEVEGLEKLKKWLVDHVPVSPKATIIHYDYKLNNVMFDYHDLGKMIGIFDWEMTTIGDPLADLGCAMSYWVQEDDPDILKNKNEKPPVTILPGFMTRDQFIEEYAKKSGRDVSQIDFYLTFAYFKLAVIVQQIFFRWKKGQTSDERFSTYEDTARGLIHVALELSTRK